MNEDLGRRWGLSAPKPLTRGVTPQENILHKKAAPEGAAELQGIEELLLLGLDGSLRSGQAGDGHPEGAA